MKKVIDIDQLPMRYEWVGILAIIYVYDKRGIGAEFIVLLSFLILYTIVYILRKRQERQETIILKKAPNIPKYENPPPPPPSNNFKGQ